ncbi:hypothetical protein ACFL5V_00745 [Fibrobacterota bacterium]
MIKKASFINGKISTIVPPSLPWDFSFGNLESMAAAISHDRKDETIENKTLWFRSLTMSERMEMLCSFTDLALTVNPKLKDIHRAQQTSGRIQVISKA